MIQRLGRARRKDGQSTFIFFTPKCVQVQSLDEISKRSSTAKSSSSGLKSQLSNSNQLKHNSSLIQIASAKDQISDTKSIADSIVRFDFDNNKCNMNDFELLSAFIAIEAEIKAKKRSGKQ